jgi:uncharacterized protein YqeY
MKTIAELKKDKIILRTSDPARAGVCEMIVDTATKTAKAEGREATDKDITSAIKKQIKQFTEAIELIKKNSGDASGHEKSLALLKEYLPPQMGEEEIRAHVMEALKDIPEEQRVKKLQGKIMGAMKQYDNIDMGTVSKILNTILK